MDDIVDDAPAAPVAVGGGEGVEHLGGASGGPTGAEHPVPDPVWPEQGRRPEGGAAWA